MGSVWNYCGDSVEEAVVELTTVVILVVEAVVYNCCNILSKLESNFVTTVVIFVVILSKLVSN